MLCLIDDFDETVSKCLCGGGNACDMIIYVSQSGPIPVYQGRSTRRVASTKDGRPERAFVSNSDISLAGTSSRLVESVNRRGRRTTDREQARTDSRMIIFPNPYQRPPAPTNAESLTLLASALSALRTRELNGGGTVKSA